jgi:hypothetical protein
MGFPFRFLVPLVLVYILRNGLDTTDPANIVWMRVFFGGCKGLVMVIYFYIFMKLKSSTDERVLKVKPSDLQPPNPMAKALGADQYQTDTAETMTIPEYDQKVLLQKVTQLVMQCAIVGFLHYYNGLTIPLVLSSVMGMWSLPTDHLVQIYVRGRDPTDPEYASELKRPFKQQSPFSDFTKPWQDMQEAQKKQEDKRAVRAQKKAKKLSVASKNKRK